MRLAWTLLLALLLAGCSTTSAPVDADVAPAVDGPPSTDAPAEAAAAQEATNASTPPLGVTPFEGMLVAWPTFGPLCPTEAAANHTFPVPPGATHARFELSSEKIHLFDANARLLLGGAPLDEGAAAEKPLTIDVGGLDGRGEIEALVWFCAGVAVPEDTYFGAISFFDRAPERNYTALVDE